MQIRVLLVNPWIYDFAAYDLWSKPLGLLEIGALLRTLGCSTRLLDCLDRFHPALAAYTKAPHPADTYGSGPYHSEIIQKPDIFKDTKRRFKRYGLPLDIVAKLMASEHEPDIILITTGMTYWYPAYIDIIDILKNRFPKAPVILGGNYPNLCFEHARSFSGADEVFRGTSTLKAIELIDKVLEGKLLKGKAFYSEDVFPSYDLYDNLSYITLKTSHGCPFRCTYCGWYLIDSAFHRQPYQFVVDEIYHFYHNMGIRNFAFYDDALIFKAEEHFLKIASGILKKGIDANFLTPNGLHNKFLSREVASAMKNTGFAKPRLALETSSRKRQKDTGGKTTNEEFLEALQNLLEAGYKRNEIGAYLLIGLPGQTMAEIEDTIRFVSENGLRMHLEEYSPIPGTDDYKKSGLSPDADPLFHNNSAFPLYPSGKIEEIQRLKDLAHNLNFNLKTK